VPRLLQFMCGLSVFFFQTMDAVDGKQARRLGTSSPLGDFLDHVVDSLCIMLSIAALVHSCSIQPFWLSVICFNSASAEFIAVHWESAKRLVMIMDNGTSITECQLLFTAVLLVEPIFGAGFWRTRIFGSSITISQPIFLVLVVLIAFNQVFRLTLPRVYKECGPRVMIEFYAPAGLNLVVSLVFLFFVPSVCRSSVVVPFEIFFIASTVLTASCVTLNRITTEPLRPWFSLAIALPALLVPLAPRILAWPFAIWSVAFVAWFLYGVILAIARKLGIPIFANYKSKITPPTSAAGTPLAH